MSLSVDYETMLIKAVWALLEANDEFASRVQNTNRIKLWDLDDDESSNVNNLKDSWDDGDFPEVTIWSPGGTDSQLMIGRAYQYRQPQPVELVITLEVFIVHLNLNWTMARRLVAETKKAIRNGGPTLGITDFQVHQVGQMTQTTTVQNGRRSDVATSDTTRRIVTQLAFPATIRGQSNSL